MYEHLQRIIDRIKSIGLFWSVSLTVTRSNFAAITDQEFIKFLTDLGCKLFFFLEYTPIKEGTEDWGMAPNDLAHQYVGTYDVTGVEFNAGVFNGDIAAFICRHSIHG